MEAGSFIDELRRALLEIEWASRRSATTATLQRITELSRSALRSIDQSEFSAGHKARLSTDLTRAGAAAVSTHMDSRRAGSRGSVLRRRAS